MRRNRFPSLSIGTDPIRGIIYGAVITILVSAGACFNKPVSYQFPRNEGRREGILKDRAFVKISTGETGIPIWDVIGLISFPNGPDWIRIG